MFGHSQLEAVQFDNDFFNTYSKLRRDRKPKKITIDNTLWRRKSESTDQYSESPVSILRNKLFGGSDRYRK